MVENILPFLLQIILLIYTFIGFILDLIVIILFIVGILTIGFIVWLYVNVPSEESFYDLYFDDTKARMLEYVKTPGKKIKEIEFDKLFICTIATEIDKKKITHGMFLGIANTWIKFKILKY